MLRTPALAGGAREVVGLQSIYMPKSPSWFFYLCALEGAAVAAALFLIPSEGGKLSLARLALLSFVLAISVVCTVLGWRPPQRFANLARPPFIIFSALLSLAFGLLLFLLRYLDPENSLSTYQR